MLNRKRKRLRLIALGSIFLAASAFLVGYGMRDGIEFFKSPSELNNGSSLVGERFRVGGLVGVNSVRSLSDGSISFEVTDNIASIEIRFYGILPDLFEENQGVIASGVLKSETLFIADEVFAKHDENYIPKELVNSLKERGVYVDPQKK